MEDGGGYSVAPTEFLWLYTVTKVEILHRLRRLVSDLKGVTSRSKFLGEETADLEFNITIIEKELAKLIDDYMAGLFARHNRRR